MIENLKYEFEDIESIEQLEDFDNGVFNILVDYEIIGGLD